MTTLGVSVYPDISSLEDIETYLKLASSYGFTRVFSSMFSVQGEKEEVLAYFDKLIVIAHRYDMEVSLDVNPICFKQMGASVDDLSVFDSIGTDILRMDMSFGEEGDLKLIQNPYNIKIEFNASFLSSDAILNLVAKGANSEDILVCHNFYPQRYTGMDWHKFNRINKDLKTSGVRVGAFISSNAENTHGVWDAKNGLPTVERLRGLPIDLQLRVLLATRCVDDILIGNAFASEDEFIAIKEALEVVVMKEDNPMKEILKAFGSSLQDEAQQNNQRRLKIKLHKDITDIEKDVLFNFFPHTDIGDSSEWIWRSRMPRFVYRDKTIKKRPETCKMFERGDVVMVNESYKNYAAEVQIVLIPIENDGDRNLVGRLPEEELLMLDLIEDRDVVIFESYE